MRSQSHFLSTTTLSNALRVSAVLGLAALALPASGALQTAVAPSPVPAQLPQAVLDGNARLVLAAASQGYLGVTVHDVDPARAEKQKLASSLGAEVISLDHDAPAAKAGVHTGDIIQAINGQVVSDAATLGRLLRDMPVGKFDRPAGGAQRQGGADASPARRPYRAGPACLGASLPCPDS